MPTQRDQRRHRDEERLRALLRRRREDAGLRQADLARRLGRSQSFVSKYEAGERRLYFHEVRQICRALNLGFAEFVEEFDSR